MPKVRVNERIKDYNRLINRDKERVEEGPYRDFLNSLSVLVNKTEELYKPDDSGHAKPMTKDNYKDLMSAYRGVQKACREYLKDDWERDKIEQSRERIVKRIQTYMKMDMSLLDGLDKEHLPSLPDAIKKARTVEIDLTGKKLETVGGMQSKRIALKSAKGTKGFFTEKSGYDKQKEWERALDRVAAEVPERYKEDFESLRNDEAKRNAFMEGSKRKNELDKLEEADLDSYMDKKYDIMTGKKNCGFGYQRLMSDEEYADAEQMKEVFRKLSIDANSIQTREGYITQAGIQSTGRLDQRNSAMTTIAELLGNSKLLSRSVPMTVIRDGKVVEGTFMEAAEGVDTHNLGYEEMYLEDCNLETVGKPQALKQFAEIQVLDYICGNIDRHVGNMLYQFKKGDDGKPYLSSITGIDNDSSFGIKKLEGNTKKAFFGGLENIGVIDARQYRTIRNLDQNVLKEALLPYEFTEREIDSVWERIEYLKREVQKKNIKVIKDKDWEKQNLNDLSKGENIFHQIGGLPNLIKHKLNIIKETDKSQKRQLEFAEGDKVKDLYRMDLEKNHKNLMKLVKGIRAADDNLYINSSAFRKMRNTAYELGKFSMEMMKRYPDADMKISVEDRNKLNELYEKMEQTSQAYIDAKKLSPKTDHGKLRLDLATDLRDLSADSCNLLEPDEPQMDAPQREEPQKEEPQMEEPEMDDGFSM